ncbi:MAG: rod shape-determining protein RodA [Deltaproteobacteria bacterium]|nr:rod shape-determining protein RodA [Deltaproteobacteria bacterium]
MISNPTDRRFKVHFHWPLLWTTLGLSAIGLVNLYSATLVLGQTGRPPLFMSQLVSIGIGFFCLFAVLVVDYRIFERVGYFLYLLSLVLLVLVIPFGKTVSGNRSWLDLGSFSFQPSEIAKLGFIFALSKFFSRAPKPEGHNFGSLGIPFLLCAIPLALILMEKDLGSSLFFVLIFASFTLFAGARKKTILILLVIGLVGAGVGYAKILSPHQKARISTFLHPASDPKGKGYHLIQSKVTVGSGKIFGKGYLRGMHNKLAYLPDKHTDFIFPVLAEEWGFLGSTVVFSLYFMMIFFALGVAAKAKERFGVCLGFGIAALLFWQVAINLGGVLGLIPLTGVTLPLLSYGGSSVITILIGIGLLLNISMRRFMF